MVGRYSERQGIALRLHLLSPQVEATPGLAEQFVAGPPLDDPAELEDEDLVDGLETSQPVVTTRTLGAPSVHATSVMGFSSNGCIEGTRIVGSP